MLYENPMDTQRMTPEILRELPEFSALCGAADRLLNDFFTAEKTVVDNLYATTADDTGLSRFASILDCFCDGGTEEQRQTVIGKLSSYPPVNLYTIRQTAQHYFGPSIFTECVGGTDFYVKYRTDAADTGAIVRALRGLLPANIALHTDYMYTMWSELAAQCLTFAQLDALDLPFAEFEKGGWLV